MFYRDVTGIAGLAGHTRLENRETDMDLQARIDLWKSIDPDPEFCRKAEREMLLLSCQDEDWVNARMRDFEQALALESAE
ncbi:hypothetical protein AB8B02_10840 [Tardiphaga sp. 862_B3_N4_1]|jgi:hypothetical protein|uniref:hypothetical protein n=1 Tax=unclassified Tardiphaga TaxID=2631404 RepID=UPI000B840938